MILAIKVQVALMLMCFTYLTQTTVNLNAAPLVVGHQERVTRAQNHSHWVDEAINTIKELDDLAKAIQEEDYSLNISEQTHAERIIEIQKFVSLCSERLVQRRKAEKMLWKLWLTTGKPPLTRKADEKFKIYLRNNAVDYQCYVTKNADLTQKDIHRIGLENAVESFGTSMWYMALKYVMEKTNLVADWTVVIHTTPSHTIIDSQLSEENYRHLSTAYSHWLKANIENMIWDQKKECFHPKDGGLYGFLCQ